MRVIFFTGALALVTPLLFGVVPAPRAAMGSTVNGLKESGPGATPGRARHRLLGSLVVVQFALALMLSVSAGLLVRSFTGSARGGREPHPRMARDSRRSAHCAAHGVIAPSDQLSSSIDRPVTDAEPYRYVSVCLLSVFVMPALPGAASPLPLGQ